MKFKMSRKQNAFFFTLFITQFFLASADLTGSNDEEEDAQKYVAQDDIDRFKNQLKIFGGQYGNAWMVLPDGDDLSHFALMNSELWSSGEGRFVTTYAQSEMKDIVKLLFYTKEHPRGEIIDLKKLDKLKYDASKPTKMILHGWRANSNSSIMRKIRDAYLEEQDVNVIGVDWSYIASNFFYPSAAAATPKVGKFLASVIDALVERKNAKYNDFHLVGHSLGAHVSGFAGNYTKRKIGRITGLDPALPGFQLGKGPANRLDPSDANFVDVIHTCAGILGLSINAGHVDFYPNGGSPFQPGCVSALPTTTQACSHGRSYKYFTESIRHHHFRAVGCPDWAHFKANKCNEVYSYMGEYASPKAQGSFYLKTNHESPYGLGVNGVFYEE